MLSVESLRTSATMSGVYRWLIELLKAAGFETDGWQPGRIQKSMFTVFAAGNADLTELGKFIAEFGYGPTSSGPALTLFSWSRYGNRRIKASKTAGPMRLRNKANSSYPIEVGSRIVADPAGFQFRNTTGGTLAPGSVGSPTELVLEFEAVKAGAAGSAVGRGTVTTLVTQLAGVSVSNDVTAPPNPWYTTTGLDEEFDTALRKRNETKWASQSLDMVKEGFEFVALNAGAVKVDIDDSNPRGQGTLDVYAGGQSSLLGTATMQALQLAFSKRVFRTEATFQNPWPVGNASLIQVKHPPTQELTLPGGIVYYTGELANVKAAVRQALLDLIILAPIGGYNYPPGPTNIITLGDLTNAVEEVTGVATFHTGLTADIAVASRHLVIPDQTDPYFGITFTAVTG